MPTDRRQSLEANDLPTDASRAPRRPDCGAKCRRHTRHDFVASLRLLIEEQDASSLEGVRRRDTEVTTCDVSRSGFAFRSGQFIHPGTSLRAAFSSLPGKPHVAAVVRNCTYISSGEHRVGAEFVARLPDAEELT